MFNGDVIGPLLDGALITVQVTVYALLIGTSLSVVSGLAGLSGNRTVRYVNQVYVDFFRGTSALVQMFWVFFALPLAGIELSALMAGSVTLGLNMGSYGSEVVRGAIRAVSRGQHEASVALNLTRFQEMRYVIFPQAVVAMLPPYGNLLIELMKGTALVSLITLPDLTFEAQKLRVNGTATTTFIFTTALVMYFILALFITAIVRSIERMSGRGIRAGQRRQRGLRPMLRSFVPWGAVQ